MFTHFYFYLLNNNSALKKINNLVCFFLVDWFCPTKMCDFSPFLPPILKGLNQKVLICNLIG